MTNYLQELCKLAKDRIQTGYYDTEKSSRRSHRSLTSTIRHTAKIPIIAEIKYASPSAGLIRKFESPLKIAKAMIDGGACALSVLTEPSMFQGHLKILSEVADNVEIPLVMKDIIVSQKQLKAAADNGADAVVLISEIFSNGLGEKELSEMVSAARVLGLEVIIEASTASEFERIKKYKPDVYGINNRNLSTFKTQLETTEDILSKSKPPDGIILSESGIETASDIRRLKQAGAQAFLVGTSLMKSPDPASKVRELVNA